MLIYCRTLLFEEENPRGGVGVWTDREGGHYRLRGGGVRVLGWQLRHTPAAAKVPRTLKWPFSREGCLVRPDQVLKIGPACASYGQEPQSNDFKINYVDILKRTF